MEGLDLGQTSNPSLRGKRNVFKINDDDDDDSLLIRIYVSAIYYFFMQ